ncbi:MAG: hypothetical protein ACK5YR_12370 [Pirellula sp.]|jgi:hypothetical protein
MDRLTFETIVRSRTTSTNESVVTLASEWYPVQSYSGPCFVYLSGFETRPGNHSVPIIDLDSEDNPLGTVRSVVGSCRKLTVRGSELICIAAYASDPEAQKIKAEFDSGVRRSLIAFVDIIEGVRLRPGERFSDSIVGGSSGSIVAVTWRPIKALTSRSW